MSANANDKCFGSSESLLSCEYADLGGAFLRSGIIFGPGHLILKNPLRLCSSGAVGGRDEVVGRDSSRWLSIRPSDVIGSGRVGLIGSRINDGVPNDSGERRDKLSADVCL